MDRGAWWDTVHGVTKSRTRLSDFTHTHTHTIMADLCCTAEPTQYYKAVTLQLKNKLKKKVDHKPKHKFYIVIIYSYNYHYFFL